MNREEWEESINAECAANPNLIWSDRWGGAPWYDTRDPEQKTLDSLLAIIFWPLTLLSLPYDRAREKKNRSWLKPRQAVAKKPSAKVRDAKESRSVGIAAMVILTLAAPMLILGLALVGALALFVVTGGG